MKAEIWSLIWSVMLFGERLGFVYRETREAVVVPNSPLEGTTTWRTVQHGGDATLQILDVTVGVHPFTDEDLPL